MNADLILDAFEKIDDKYIIEAKERGFMNSGTGKSIRSLKRTFILVASIVASLALCGFADVYKRQSNRRAVWIPSLPMPRRCPVT